jgi:cobalt-zinc-cadmium efflux system membrane fusion protein
MDSETKSANSARAPGVARVVGATLVIGLAAAAVHFITRDSSSAKCSFDGTQGKSEPGTLPSDVSKDEVSQVVRLSPEILQKYSVQIGVARKRTLVREITAPARVAFNSEATAIVGTPVQGRVVAVNVRAGHHIEAGAVLAEIESAELGEAQSDFLQRQAAVETARAAIQPLTEIFERIKKLHEETRLIGITEVQERELELKKAEGALATARAAANASANKLHSLGMDDDAIDELLRSGKVTPRYALRSPLAGEVIERLVNVGELVKPDREKLFVVADTQTLWLWADVPEARAREVALGATAQITLAAAGEQSFLGVVSHISPRIDDATRALRVRIEVQSDPTLRPGMFALVTITGKASGDNAEPMLAVPEAAIQIVNGSTAVFVSDNKDANAFEAQLVSTGDHVDDMVAIISGLYGGERIVTAGSAILKAELLKATAKDED